MLVLTQKRYPSFTPSAPGRDSDDLHRETRIREEARNDNPGWVRVVADEEGRDPTASDEVFVPGARQTGLVKRQ
jgi:hypothetical protein